jgi:hypothetical protein
VDNSIEAELSNISTRSFVQTGDDVMIGGLIIEGNAPATVLIRARGPSMSGAPFFVPGTLADPFLQLFSGQKSSHKTTTGKTPRHALDLFVGMRHRSPRLA